MGVRRVVADGHKESKKSSPALRHLGSEKVRWDPHPQNPVRHPVKAEHAAGVERSYLGQRNKKKLHSQQVWKVGE